VCPRVVKGNSRFGYMERAIEIVLFRFNLLWLVNLW